MSRSAPAKFKDRLAVLNRRADWLKERIDNYHGNDAGRDKAELAALVWAIEVIEDNSGSALDIIKQYIGYAEDYKDKKTSD